MDYLEYIKNNTIRCEASYRGGGIEIGLDDLLDTEGYKMTAYQNYLGGGMLGRICHQYNFVPDDLSKRKQKIVEDITLSLKSYFHSLTNHEDDERESASYEVNQSRPVSAY